MNPDLFSPIYRKVDIRGGKVYYPLLLPVVGAIHIRLRGTFKTATRAQARAQRFLSTWKRWHRIWQAMGEEPTP